MTATKGPIYHIVEQAILQIIPKSDSELRIQWELWKNLLPKIQELESQSLGVWISVEDRLPEKGGEYLARHSNSFHGPRTQIMQFQPQFGVFQKKGQPLDSARHPMEKTTYWLEIPHPPSK